MAFEQSTNVFFPLTSLSNERKFHSICFSYEILLIVYCARDQVNIQILMGFDIFYPLTLTDFENVNIK